MLAVSADKDVAGILDELEPVAAAVSRPATPRRGRWSQRSWPTWQSACSGPTGCIVAERLDDAIEAAVWLAEVTRDRRPLGLTPAPRTCAARRDRVLMTGSVITAGDARRLLRGARRRIRGPGARERLCATVLIMEAIVIALAIPVALNIEHAPAPPGWYPGASRRSPLCCSPRWPDGGSAGH